LKNTTKGLYGSVIVFIFIIYIALNRAERRAELVTPLHLHRLGTVVLFGCISNSTPNSYAFGGLRVWGSSLLFWVFTAQLLLRQTVRSAIYLVSISTMQR